MKQIENYSVAVIGGGPAGMAAAIAAAEKNPNARIALIEREAQVGGILKQCIHDGFGLIRFKERLTGPEYAYRYKEILKEHKNIEVFCFTFLTKLEKITSEKINAEKIANNKGEETGEFFKMEFTNPQKGIFSLTAKALVAAMGCRERTDRQVNIHGERPAGIFTAGLAQAFINLHGYLPGKKCVILGSGDIGLIIARRLTLEGAKVEGVYEIKPTPSGLTRNIVQCLNDYGIPLHLSTTVTSVKGRNRVEAVEVMQVDKNMKPITGTKKIIPCDTLILSVGLIPENDILSNLNIEFDNRTKGPIVDQFMQTSLPGLFSCGNALHVNDLVDYVSESGKLAGEAAVKYVEKNNSKTQNTSSINKRKRIKLEGKILYLVPQEITPETHTDIIFYFRSSEELSNAKIIFKADEKIVFEKKYKTIKPPEMERFVLSADKLQNAKNLSFSIEEAAYE